MEIGLISDTHGYLDPRITTLLKFTIASGKVERVRLIELGPRGKRLNDPYDSPAPIQVRFDGK